MTIPSTAIKGRRTVYDAGTASTFTVNPTTSSGSAIATGDFLFMDMFVATGTTPSTPASPPAGWTEVIPYGLYSSGATGTYGLWVRRRQAGDSTYTVGQTYNASGGMWIGLYWIDGATGLDPDKWIFGAAGTRASSGGGTQTTAPAVASLAPDSAALLWVAERTGATKNVTKASVDASFTEDQYYSNTLNQGVYLAHKDLATAATAGPATVTFDSSHATNSIGKIIIIPSVPAPVQNVVASRVSSTSVSVAWTHPSDAPSGVSILRAPGTVVNDGSGNAPGSAAYDPTSVTGATVIASGLTASPYSDTGLTPGTYTYWAVRS